MKKHFYSHLVETSELSLSLGDLELTQEERVELITLMESSLHHVVLDTILSELSEKDKKQFLLHIHNNDHAKIWKHLRETVDDIEDKIQDAAAKLKKDLQRDIHDVKRHDKRRKAQTSK